MLTTDIKYAIGIDFGHGETSFSYYKITWGKDVAGQEASPTTAIALADGHKTIPSIYLYNRGTDQMFIGRPAGINYGQIGGDRSNYVYGVSFKKPISRMSDEERFFFKRYMMEVKKVLLSCCPVTLEDEDSEMHIKRNYVVVIAKPSGWLNEEDELYLNLAEEAGLPVVGIWPESRASIMRFISKDDSTSITNREGLSVHDINQIHDGCVLMDIGSSTTDFSYINKYMNYPIDDNGNNCGGQIIDELLLQYVLSLSENAELKKDISEAYNDSLYNYLLFEIRMAKEKLFSGVPQPGLHVRAYYDSPTLPDQELRCRFKDCNLETITRLLNEGLDAFGITPAGKRFKDDDDTYPRLVKHAVRNGFIPTLRYELGRFIRNLAASDRDHKINCFILTGGTSKLFKVLGIDTYFRPNILSGELSDYSECNVYMDTEPSTSVSDGLALVGRNYALFKGCLDENPSLNVTEREKAKGLKIQLDILVDEILRSISAESVKEDIAKEIRDKIMTKATDVINRFAGHHSKNPSLDDLKRDFTRAISSACSNSGQIISDHIRHCLRSKLGKEKQEIDKLVYKYTVQQVTTPSTDKYSSMSDISINVNVQEIIYRVSSKLTEEVIIKILYLFLLPSATVIWGIGRIINLFSDEPPVTFEEFFEDFINGVEGPMTWVATRGRLRQERLGVQSRFNEEKSDIAFDAYEKIKEKLSDIDDIVDQGIKEIIESYKEDAYKAIERVFK